MLDRAVDLDQLRRARLAVQHVDVLRDDGVELAAALEGDQRAVRSVGLLALERLEAIAIEVPEALRVGAPRIDVRDLHRVDVLPQPGAGRAEVGDPGRHRDPRAGQRDDGAGLADEACQALYLPVHSGLRLPRNALIPSLPSSDWNAVPKPAFSASMPASISPLALTFLTCSTASGACSASLRAHASALSNSSWSTTTRLTSPNSNASSAPTGSPTRFISSALLSPTSRGSRWVPPKPGMMPSLISGWPNEAESAAIRRSHDIASSHPPPKASELTAAMVATRDCPRSRNVACAVSMSSLPCCSSICVNALMSAPAEKTTGELEAMISARTSPRSLTRFHVVVRSWTTCGAMELTWPLASQAMATPCARVSSLTVSVWSPSSACG